MNILAAVLLGFIEGITEFLPISSTAHLILVSHFLQLQQTDFQKFFEVFIQSGAILAVVVLYFSYLLKHRSYIIKIIVSFLPTAFFGFLFYKIIKNVFFESFILIATMLFFVGIIFLIVEFLIKRKTILLQKTIPQIDYKQAFIIGFFQSFAIVPGVSRAGAVILTMMFLGFRRKEAALYSFLLAVPTILAASGFDLSKTNPSILERGNLVLLAVGFATSFITALLVIRWFIEFLQKHTLRLFGFYRIFAAFLFLLGK